jgi:tetratricopeptide (TPR) repeat protein
MIYQNIGELNYSIISFQASLQIEEKNGNLENQASLLNSIGEVYTDMGYFSNGLKNLYSGLKLTEENNDPYNNARILFSISQIFFKQDDYNSSLNLLNQAESIAKDEDISSLIPKIHKTRGAIHVQEGKFNEAHSEYHQSLKGV